MSHVHLHAARSRRPSAQAGWPVRPRAARSTSSFAQRVGRLTIADAPAIVTRDDLRPPASHTKTPILSFNGGHCDRLQGGDPEAAGPTRSRDQRRPLGRARRAKVPPVLPHRAAPLQDRHPRRRHRQGSGSDVPTPAPRGRTPSEERDRRGGGGPVRGRRDPGGLPGDQRREHHRRRGASATQSGLESAVHAGARPCGDGARARDTERPGSDEDRARSVTRQSSAPRTHRR